MEVDTEYSSDTILKKSVKVHETIRSTIKKAIKTPNYLKTNKQTKKNTTTKKPTTTKKTQQDSLPWSTW